MCHGAVLVHDGSQHVHELGGGRDGVVHPEAATSSANRHVDVHVHVQEPLELPKVHISSGTTVAVAHAVGPRGSAHQYGYQRSCAALVDSAQKLSRMVTRRGRRGLAATAAMSLTQEGQ